MPNSSPGSDLVIATWNVLAAPWAAASFYPDGMDAAVLDRAVRSALVGAHLAVIDADVVCLQETTPPDLAAIVSHLLGYESFATTNTRDLWSKWSTGEVTWEPNGTAIVWRARAFDDITTGAFGLSDDGNIATWMRARHVSSGRRVRILSVHLDADEAPLRRAQLPIALGFFGAEPGCIDVVAGDCNEDTVGTDLGERCDRYEFADALTVLGCTEPTHPYARPSDDYAPIARLDHVLVRGTRPISGAVIDSGVWQVDIPGERMEEHLRRTGSDHLPVTVTVHT